MLDPLTALSVAGNIVQFTDFSIKLLKESHELYAAADGSLQHNRKFGLIGDDVKPLVDQVRKSISAPSGSVYTRENSSLAMSRS